MKLIKFIDYFRFRTEHYYVLLLDICYYLISFLALSVYGGFLQNWADKLGDVSVDNLLALPEERLAEITEILSKFWTTFIVYSILFVLFLILVYGIFKSLVWSIVIKKKINYKFILKFIVLNIVWLAIVILILDTISLIAGSGTFQEFNFLSPIMVILEFNILHPIASIIIYLILLHTTSILQVYFTREGLGGVKHTLQSFKRAHIFLYNYLFAIIPLAVVLLLGFLFQFLPKILNTILSAIVIIVFITWMRFYIVGVIEENKI